MQAPQRVGWRQAAIAALAFAGMAVANPAGAQAIITNGIIKLGVRATGALNVDGSVGSYQGGNLDTGMRYLKPSIGELEYTADGSPQEGWGVGDSGSGVSCSDNREVNPSGGTGMTLDSFASTATTATSVVETSAANAVKLRITQYYHPSAQTHLYQCDVTIANIGTATATNVIYRRVMDWDIEPTHFNEIVSMAGWPNSNLLWTDDNGFNSADALDTGHSGTHPNLNNINFTGDGPDDLGMDFGFKVGTIAPGGVHRLRLYYGADNTAAAVQTDLTAVGANVYSTAAPSVPASNAAYSVAAFGFSAVKANAGPDQTTTANSVTLDGSGSNDPSGEALTYAWSEGGTQVATGVTPTVTLAHGAHTLTLTVTNTDGQTDSDTVNIVVDDAPVAVSDSDSAGEDLTLSVAAPGVLGNDTDSDGDPLTAILVSGPAHGSVTLNADGSFIYTPTSGYVGSDSFTYKAGDGYLNSSTATVRLVVTDTTPPTTTAVLNPATPDGLSGWYVHPVTVTLTPSDPDDAASTLTTKYTTDGSDPTTSSAATSVSGAGPFTQQITADGTYTLKFYSIDPAGNAQAVQTVSGRLDQTAPAAQLGMASPAPNAAGWNNTSVTLPYTASDSGSGVATPAGGSGTVIFSSVGAGQTLPISVTDVAGNSVTVTTTPAINIDEAPPVTVVATQTGADGVMVTLSATDDLSGVASTVYRLDGGAAQTYGGAFTVSGNGPHTVTFHSTDKADNVEADGTLQFTTNVAAPITTATLSGPQGRGSWYTGPVTVTLSAQPHGLPVAQTLYTLDGGPGQTYHGAPFTVSGDGTHTILFWSVDTAGNEEAHNQQPVKIDGTVPTLTFGRPSQAPNAAGWTSAPFTLPFTAADATSGVATAAPGSPVAFRHEGRAQTISVTVTDNAGNSKAFPSPAFSLDFTAPVTTGVAQSVAGGQQVTLTASDALSGVAATIYSVDGGPQTTYTGPFTIPASMTVSGPVAHDVTFHSVDGAGNAEAVQSLAVTTASAVLHTFPAGLQLFSVPKDFSGIALGTALSQINPRLWSWAPAAVQYTLAASMVPGLGYWARFGGATALYDLGTPTPTGQPFPIGLQKGWNMIGDPFPGSVSLSGVRVQGAGGQPLSLGDANKAGLVALTFYSYPAGSSQYQTENQNGSLAPYLGYWLYAFQNCTLEVPAP